MSEPQLSRVGIPLAGKAPLALGSAAVLHLCVYLALGGGGAVVVAQADPIAWVEIQERVPVPLAPVAIPEPPAGSGSTSGAVASSPPTHRAPSHRTRLTAAPSASQSAPDPFSDFTQTVLSGPDNIQGAATNAGGGGTGAGGGDSGEGSSTARSFAPVESLARPPVPPDLSALLESRYPAGARARSAQGEAVMIVDIARDGLVVRVRGAASSTAEFSAACELVLRGSRWSAPIDREGQAVATRVRYRCRFQIR